MIIKTIKILRILVLFWLYFINKMKYTSTYFYMNKIIFLFLLVGISLILMIIYILISEFKWSFFIRLQIYIKQSLIINYLSTNKHWISIIEYTRAYCVSFEKVSFYDILKLMLFLGLYFFILYTAWNGLSDFWKYPWYPYFSLLFTCTFSIIRILSIWKNIVDGAIYIKNIKADINPKPLLDIIWYVPIWYFLFIQLFIYFGIFIYLVPKLVDTFIQTT